MTRPLRVSIVEDDPPLLADVTRVISSAGDMTFAGGGASAEDALAKLPADRADVVLMDINLPGLSGIECVRQLRDRVAKEKSAIVISKM